MAKNTIRLKNYLNIFEEYEAESAIIPGELIELTTTGTVQVHSTEGGNSEKMFAIEDELQGKGIDDAYAAGDQVQCWLPVSGDQVYAILEDGNSVAIGNFLESNGTGELQLHVSDTADSDDSITVYPEQIVAVALEAVDLSGSSGDESSGWGFDSSIAVLGFNRRIKVRVV